MGDTFGVKSTIFRDLLNCFRFNFGKGSDKARKDNGTMKRLTSADSLLPVLLRSVYVIFFSNRVLLLLSNRH